MDEETGKPLEGVYVGCVGLFEVRRSTPFYIPDIETIRRDVNNMPNLKEQIEEKYGKIPKGVKIEYVYKQQKPDVFKVDATKWGVMEILRYTNDNPYEIYAPDFFPSRIFSWEDRARPASGLILPFTGRAKTDNGGNFVINELYAPVLSIMEGGFAFEYSVEKYHSKSLSELLKKHNVVNTIAIVFQVFNPGYEIMFYGEYGREIDKEREVVTPVDIKKPDEEKKLAQDKKYILMDNELYTLENIKGYEYLSNIPGQLYKGVRPCKLKGYEIFKKEIPELSLDLKLKKVEEEDRKEYEYNLMELIGWGSILGWAYGGYSSQPDNMTALTELKNSLIGETTKLKKEIGEKDKTELEILEIREKRFGLDKPAPRLMSEQNKTASVSTTDVVIEEYVPRVIIEGKWGTGPGEFGIFYDINEAELSGIPYPTPNSITVNSKGEIYILDLLNNRIQKFDSNGIYLLSIPVLGLTNEKGESSIMSSPYSGLITGLKTDTIFGSSDKPIEIKGVNIVIDSQDNLYYYCKRKGKGKLDEWVFKNDKLIEKNVDKGLGAHPYQHLKGYKVVATGEKRFSHAKGRTLWSEIDVENPTGKKIKIKAEKSKHFINESTEILSSGDAIITVVDSDESLWHARYNPEGKLISMSRPLPITDKDRQESNFTSDRQGGILQWKTTPEGMPITKWERKSIAR